MHSCTYKKVCRFLDWKSWPVGFLNFEVFTSNFLKNPKISLVFLIGPFLIRTDWVYLWKRKAFQKVTFCYRNHRYPNHNYYNHNYYNHRYHNYRYPNHSTSRKTSAFCFKLWDELVWSKSGNIAFFSDSLGLFHSNLGTLRSRINNTVRLFFF